MKKMFKKHGTLRCIGALMTILAFVLFIIAAFVDGTADMILKAIGLCLFVVGGLFVTVNSDDHRYVKSLLVFIVAAFIASWVFPYGYFQGSNYIEYGFRRLGLVDIGYTLYYAINFTMDKLAFLLLVGGFYGVLTKTSGYQKIVGGLAKKLSKHVLLTSVITSVILFVLTSLISQTMVVLLFVPFFVSVLAKMNLDNVTTFAVTFGSVLVGILGMTYGTDALSAFNTYTNQLLTVGLTYRFIIAAVSLVLYEFFLVFRIKKVNTKKTDKNDLVDPFEVETSKAKSSAVPMVIVLTLTAIIVILGYISWYGNWEIEAFNKLHTWLVELDPFGNEFNIFSYVLGVNAAALGALQYVFTIGGFLVLVSVFVAFLYRMSVNEYISAAYDGIKAMIRPILYVLGAYILFGFCYMCPFIPTLVNWLLNLIEGFNPFLTSVVAFIVSAFHSDLGYSAYTVGSMVTTAYADNIDVVHTIFTSMYGLVQLFLPSSVILGIGLSLMKVDYKSWLKYIWVFLVGMLVVLFIVFAILTYI